MTQPVDGFAHAAISTMFNPPATTPLTPSSPTPNPSTSNNSTTSPAAQHHREINAATIAGAVVGAVTGLIVIVGLSVWILHRKSRKDRSERSVHQEPARGSGGGGVLGTSECKELSTEKPPQELPTEPPPQELPAYSPQVKMTRSPSGVESDSASYSQSRTLGSSSCYKP